MDSQQLAKILEDHQIWLDTRFDSNVLGTKANLYGANLERADLWEANLKGANLWEANLERANLREANLERANLYGANLREANLERANLERADLYGADLYGADLSKANLKRADLSKANLEGANLEGANLEGANLWRAIGNDIEVKNIKLDVYTIAYTSEVLQIGCKQYPICNWWDFNDETIEKMDVGALEWWITNKDYIRDYIESNPAKPTH